jgi:hypothetical protein
VLQLCLTASKPFALELSITDEMGSRRRLNISSGFSKVHATLMHAQVPLLGMEERRGVRLTLCIGGALSLRCNHGLCYSKHHAQHMLVNKHAAYRAVASITALLEHISDLVDIVKHCFKTVYRTLDMVKISPSLKLRKVR